MIPYNYLQEEFTFKESTNPQEEAAGEKDTMKTLTSARYLNGQV